MLIHRVIIIVLDSLGIGCLSDACRYGDENSNTLGHIAEAMGGLELPALRALGLGNATNGKVVGLPVVDMPSAAFGRMAEMSPGKDTTTGHWEIAGIILDKPFPTYPSGFPQQIILAFEKEINRKVLGNEAASGTEIICRLGEEHMRTGNPIVYTSADSVFQIAAHEEIIPLNELYKMCLIARRILGGEHAVGRVIARPFIGFPGKFSRTKNRKDYSLKPPSGNLLTSVTAAGMEVISIGKIDDIFSHEGITRSIKTSDNMDGINKINFCLENRFRGLVFSNLVDFDMVYGHRNDTEGYGKALEAFDKRLPEILSNLEDDDVLVITADHGCDPTFPGTDHTREYVPLLVFGNRVRACALGTRETFADVGATIAELLGVQQPGAGKSFARQILS